MDQKQLWDAGPVRISHSRHRRTVAGELRERERSRERTKKLVASGEERARMERRRAKKLGITIAQLRELRAARSICLALRRAAVRPQLLTKTCIECGRSFETRIQEQKICGSPACRRKRNSRQTSKAIMRRYHSDATFRDERIANVQARRASKLGLGVERITLGYLLERDGWRCGICRHKIRSFDEASIDHIVPLSQGGAHSLKNVQASHRKCNYSKGNRGGGEQTLLFG